MNKRTFNENELAYQVWKAKYAHADENSPNDTIERVAKAFSEAEESYRNAWMKADKDKLSKYGREREFLTYDKIIELMGGFKYIVAGGSVLSGIGSPKLVSLSNCFVIGSPKDSYSGIMRTRAEQVELMSKRGGVGYDLSELRPRNAKVNNAANTSTGAASFMDVNSDLTNETCQQGRRGALMLSISIVHPDSKEFATKKQDLTKVTGANISIKITDEFMMAVSNDDDFIQRFPITLDISNVNKDDLEYDRLTQVGLNCFVKKVKAKELWNTIIHCAWNTAEPGLIFEDTMHEFAPDGVYEQFKMVSTNPLSWAA